MDELIFRKPVSKTIQTDVGECDVKDIRQMMGMFKKQNVNFLEILFTDYYFVPKRYEGYLMELVEHRERIARFDEKKASACILGIFNNEYKRLFREDDADVQEHGYRRKSYCNIHRLLKAMDRYCSLNEEGLPYSYRYVISGAEYKSLKKRLFPIGMVKSNTEKIKANIEKVYHEFNPLANELEMEKTKTMMDGLTKRIITESL